MISGPVIVSVCPAPRINDRHPMIGRMSELRRFSIVYGGVSISFFAVYSIYYNISAIN